MNKIFATLVLSSILLVSTAMSAYAGSGSGSATGSVTIAGTCGLTVGSSSINYGTLVPGTTPTQATTNPLTLNNTGSVPAVLTITGANWLNGATTIINANETQVSNTTSSGTYRSVANGTPMLLTSSFNVTPHGNSLSTYWQLIPKLLNTGFAGSLTQSLTFGTSC